MSEKPTYEELEKKIQELEQAESERKWAEDALHQYKHIVSSSTDMLALLDKQFKYLAVNKAYIEAFDLTLEQLIGNTVTNVFGEEFFKTVIKPNGDRCLSGEQINYQNWFNFPVHGRRYMDITYYPYYSENNKIMGFVVNGRNITEHKRVDEALQHKTHDLDERVKELNCLYSISKIWKRSSFSFEEMIQEIVDLLPASWQYPEITCAQVIIEGIEYRTKNFNQTKWKLSCDIIVHYERVGALEVYYLSEKPKSDEGPFLHEERRLIDNISEQLGRIVESERIEEAFRESENRFRSLFESNSAIMYLVDPDSLAIVDANYTAEKFSGFSRTKLKTKKLQDISTISEDEMRKEIRNAREKNRDCLMFKHKLANGETRDVEIRSTQIKIKEDEVLNFVIAHDITDRLRSEEDKKKLETQLLKAQKIEAIGTLAGGISHDFNNILWIINGNVELAVDEISPESPARYNLECIEDACRRATDLVLQILSFIPKSEQKRHPLKISSMVEESLRLLRSSIPTTIEIRKIISNRSELILADLTQINQILMNLYTNAIHAMRKDGGVLEVSLVDMVIEDKEAVFHHDLSAGKYVVLSIHDTGHGIETESIGRIFDPYFTTKEIGEGTGTGLAVVDSIIKSYGGTISVDSTLGKGTVFHVCFPVFDKGEAELGTETFETLPRGGERILFVDDEEAVLDMVKKVLTRLGYEVDVCQSPMNAIKSFAVQPEKYDLVITDQSMPYINGENLSIELMNIRPDIPIILCTGYSELVSEEKTKSIGIKAFLMKPVVKDVFAKTIRDVLDQS
jgi:PAS domain S-box-containing protein